MLSPFIISHQGNNIGVAVDTKYVHLISIVLSVNVNITRDTLFAQLCFTALTLSSITSKETCIIPCHVRLAFKLQ